MSRLDELDLSLSLDKKEEKKRLAAAQDRLLALRLRLGGQTGDGTLGPPVLLLFEGWDAAGKGGIIRRLVPRMDPRHVRVVGFGSPTEDELRHHYLWRFWPLLPGDGGFAVFDRSWYGRVLVERVDGLAPTERWNAAYGEIRAIEEMLVAGGMVLVKFWLQISAQEQLERFEARRDDPLKSWKLTDADWHNRERRPAYEDAVRDMLEHTDTAVAPWTLIAAESKRWARVAVIEEVVARIEAGLLAAGLELPVAPG